jgi:hypothetical protein
LNNSRNSHRKSPFLFFVQQAQLFPTPSSVILPIDYPQTGYQHEVQLRKNSLASVYKTKTSPRFKILVTWEYIYDPNNNDQVGAGGMAQAIQHQPSKSKTLSSNPVLPNK